MSRQNEDATRVRELPGEIGPKVRYTYNRIVCSYPRYSQDTRADATNFGNIRYPEYGFWKVESGRNVWYAKSQATPAYGIRTRDLCISYGIEVISGWWERDDVQPLNNFNSAFDSIDLGQLRIAYMFGVNTYPSSESAILTKVGEWANVMTNRNRYAYITDARGAARPILMIWGIVNSAANAAKFKAMIMGSDGVRKRVERKTGATPFIIMSQHNASGLPLADVITSVDAFYQHECAIPPLNQVISTAQSINGTRQMLDTAIRNLSGKTSAATGLPVYFIPGAMPQFNRRLVARDDHGTVEARSRGEVQRMFEMVRDYAPTISTSGTPNRLVEQKWVTITSLNEWPEGQTIEPSLVRAKPPQFPNPVKYNPPECDYGYDFLELVRDVFRDSPWMPQ